MKKIKIISLMLITTVIIGILPACAKKDRSIPIVAKKEHVKLINEKSNNEPFTIILKNTNKSLIYPEWEDVKTNELWIEYSDGKEELLVSSKAIKDPDIITAIEKTIAGINNPQLSPDKERVYFMSAAWPNSDAIHVVNIQTKSEKYVCPGNFLKVIQSGQYSGKLIVNQHRYYDAPKVGSYDNYYIIDEQGKEIKNLGDREEGLKDYE